MPPQNLRSAVEALLFSSDQPLTLAQLADALEAAEDTVTEALGQLGDEYRSRTAGVEVREMAGGWIITTTSEQNEWVTRMLRGKRKMRLSRAALETLAIIAYKQPVTKSEIEAIRGVDSSGTLATLLERALVTIKGRSTVVGRPLLYGSTPEFLNYFGLKDLTELPRPEELRALVAAREPEQLEMMELDPEGMPLALAANTEAGETGDAVADREPVADEDAVVAPLEASAAEDDEDGLVDDEEFEEFEGDGDDDDDEEADVDDDEELEDDDDLDADEDEDEDEFDDDDEDADEDDLDEDDLEGLDDLDRDGDEDDDVYNESDKGEKQEEQLEEAFLVGSDLETASDSDDDDDSDDEDEFDDDDDDDEFDEDDEDEGDLDGDDDDDRPGAELRGPEGR